jgi:hypothetical protein
LTVDDEAVIFASALSVSRDLALQLLLLLLLLLAVAVPSSASRLRYRPRSQGGMLKMVFRREMKRLR